MDTATAAKVTLTKTAAGVEVAANGRVLAIVKDGNNLIARTDRILLNNYIQREGYTVEAGVFTASGMQY